MAQTPHFDLPFRLGGGSGDAVHSAAVVEQDSFEDIANCVEVIVRCPFGFREDNILFGFPELALVTQPVLSEVIRDVVAGQELRAEIFMTEHPDRFDALVDRITVEIRENPDSAVTYGLHQDSA